MSHQHGYNVKYFIVSGKPTTQQESEHDDVEEGTPSRKSSCAWASSSLFKKIAAVIVLTMVISGTAVVLVTRGKQYYINSIIQNIIGNVIKII